MKLVRSALPATEVPRGQVSQSDQGQLAVGHREAGAEDLVLQRQVPAILWPSETYPLWWMLSKAYHAHTAWLSVSFIHSLIKSTAFLDLSCARSKKIPVDKIWSLPSKLESSERDNNSHSCKVWIIRCTGLSSLHKFSCFIFSTKLHVIIVNHVINGGGWCLQYLDNADGFPKPKNHSIKTLTLVHCIIKSMFLSKNDDWVYSHPFRVKCEIVLEKWGIWELLNFTTVSSY